MNKNNCVDLLLVYMLNKGWLVECRKYILSVDKMRKGFKSENKRVGHHKRSALRSSFPVLTYMKRCQKLSF